mmetsp:Transcript_4072/g.4707  ORF Transcript_4072/g.4707 Transcript_4072/m.4707 type:complete len:525 (+) Transcript_4072:379-1953(+)
MLSVTETSSSLRAMTPSSLRGCQQADGEVSSPISRNTTARIEAESSSSAPPRVLSKDAETKMNESVQKSPLQQMAPSYNAQQTLAAQQSIFSNSFIQQMNFPSMGSIDAQNVVAMNLCGPQSIKIITNPQKPNPKYNHALLNRANSSEITRGDSDNKLAAVNLKNGSSMCIQLPTGFSIQYNPSSMLNASFLLGQAANINIKELESKHASPSSKDKSSPKLEKQSSDLSNLDDLLSDSTLPVSNLNVPKRPGMDKKPKQAQQSGAANTPLNPDPKTQSLYISDSVLNLNLIGAKGNPNANTSMDSDSAKRASVSTALLNLYSSTKGASTMQNGSSTPSNVTGNTNNVHGINDMDISAPVWPPTLASLASAVEVMGTNFMRGDMSAHMKPEMTSPDKGTAYPLRAKQLAKFKDRRNDRSTGQWSKQEESVLLHLVKGMVDCELKMIAKAAKACKIYRQPRAVDKKLKRLIGFKNWKTRDKGSILARVHKVIENRVYELTKERKELVENAIGEFSPKKQTYNHQFM